MVRKIREEIDEIVENGVVEWRLKHRVDFLVNVEHNHYGKQQNDGEHVRAQEFAYDIPVENGEQRVAYIFPLLKAFLLQLLGIVSQFLDTADAIPQGCFELFYVAFDVHFDENKMPTQKYR